jgi:hypothetical protein
MATKLEDVVLTMNTMILASGTDPGKEDTEISQDQAVLEDEINGLINVSREMSEEASQVQMLTKDSNVVLCPHLTALKSLIKRPTKIGETGQATIFATARYHIAPQTSLAGENYKISSLLPHFRLQPETMIKTVLQATLDK